MIFLFIQLVNKLNQMKFIKFSEFILFKLYQFYILCTFIYSTRLNVIRTES